VILTMVTDFARRLAASRGADASAKTAQEELSALLQREQELLQKFGPSYYEVQAVRKKIEIARALLTRPALAFADSADGKGGPGGADPVAWYQDNLTQQLDYLKTSERLLTSLYDQEQDEARRLSSYEIQDEMMRADITRTQELYESVVKQL